MWFWPVNEMTELVSGMPAPQLGHESSGVRGSELLQGSSGSVRCFHVLHKIYSRTPGSRPLVYLRPFILHTAEYI
jgi:hypothetical protein